MERELSSIPSYFNLLESEQLLQFFQQFPPEGFQIIQSPQGLPCFFTEFDLLTTVEPELKNRITGWPLYRYWGRWLKFPTCFVGTTVSEYTPLPAQSDTEELLNWLSQACLQQQSLTIIKDLPENSPLLSEEENDYSQRLMITAQRQGYIKVMGQALAYVPIDFSSLDEYLSRLSASRRRDMRRKMKNRAYLRVERVKIGEARFYDPQWLDRMYQLYLAVYQQSEIHFDLLSPSFFTALLQQQESQGLVFFYWYEEELVGYNLCYIQHGCLIDKYIGLNYPLAREHNLYFISWFENLAYALEQGLQCYIAGWTDPQVKAALGASFTFTSHLVWVRNPLLRALLKSCRHLFESDKAWSEEQQKNGH